MAGWLAGWLGWSGLGDSLESLRLCDIPQQGVADDSKAAMLEEEQTHPKLGSKVGEQMASNAAEINH